MENIILTHPQPTMQIYVPDFIELTLASNGKKIIVARKIIETVMVYDNLTTVHTLNNGVAYSEIAVKETIKEIGEKLGLNLNFNLTCEDVKG